MKKNSPRGMSEDGGMSVTDLHAGMTNKSPKPPGDWSKPASVDSDAVRENTSPSQPTLGGRVA